MVAKAPPDGYTLGLFDTAFAINPALQEKLPYDARRDFVFVAIVATSPTLLVAQPLPHRPGVIEVGLSVQDLRLDRARRERHDRYPAPGMPALMTGSSFAPCAFEPNVAGLVRPTRV